MKNTGKKLATFLVVATIVGTMASTYADEATQLLGQKLGRGGGQMIGDMDGTGQMGHRGHGMDQGKGMGMEGEGLLRFEEFLTEDEKETIENLKEEGDALRSELQEKLEALGENPEEAERKGVYDEYLDELKKLRESHQDEMEEIRNRLSEDEDFQAKIEEEKAERQAENQFRRDFGSYCMDEDASEDVQAMCEEQREEKQALEEEYRGKRTEMGKRHMQEFYSVVDSE